jgi:hypothetical protein
MEIKRHVRYNPLVVVVLDGIHFDFEANTTSMIINPII